MEVRQSDGSLVKREPMAHKFEVPLEDRDRLIGLAESVLSFDKDDKEGLSSVLVDFKIGVLEFANVSQLNQARVDAIRDDKLQARGGFTKRAVQRHPILGINGLRLVRDKLSDGVFLKPEEATLYQELLGKKLIEETKELVEKQGARSRAEEMGDVLEVFDAILLFEKIDPFFIEGEIMRKNFEKMKERRKLSKVSKKK